LRLDRTTPPMPTVTIRVIAQHTGFSKSTVASALKGDPGHAKKTVEKVQAAAKKLGYVPNPLVTAGMMRIRDAKHFTTGHTTIGYLSDVPWRSLDGGESNVSGENDARDRTGYLGARARAVELGFNLDFIEYAKSKMSSARLRTIIRTRGILGFIIAPHHRPQVKLDLRWEEFAVVCVGYSVTSPRFDRVGFDHHEAIVDLCSRMKERGHRRIGFVLASDYDARVLHVTRAGFVRWQTDHCRVSDCVPVAVGSSRDALQTWFRKHRPDCIIAQGEDSMESLDQLDLERKHGVPIVSLVLTPGFEQRGGFDMSLRTLAANAVDLLAGKLYRNERGLPENRHSVMVLGTWREPSSDNSG